MLDLVRSTAQVGGPDEALCTRSSPWDACKDMGPNERVKTQHCDWNHQSKVLSTGSSYCLSMVCAPCPDNALAFRLFCTADPEL